MTKLMMSMSITNSLMFTQMKHPMAMGMMLLIQTMTMCMISGSMYKSFWFSYILFMIMVGGMLVLFMYMTSIASNEMLSPSNKMITTATIATLMTMNYMTTKTNSKEMNNHDSMTENEITTTTNTMYNQITGSMTILLVTYMLMTLIVVVNMINMSKGPLRKTN
uniref:NADH-ubiquinone oxidoreductase chain 6 n=1 Tax=Stylotermes sp. Chi-131 TaxID=2045235 RepID=A0A343L8W6_9NEOP|nr:NADH dehydrogenase subunit 6 [Stylotermes sp. Chi-131]